MVIETKAKTAEMEEIVAEIKTEKIASIPTFNRSEQLPGTNGKQMLKITT